MTDVEHAQSGGTETIPFALTNQGNESAHGVTVKMRSRHLAPPEKAPGHSAAEQTQ
ncbi:hypothetical protein ACWCQW_20485 [Streptomyces mirabilis]